jgi:hypothetical protein
MELKMKNVTKLLVVGLLLAANPLPLIAGGDTSGGGSSLKGKLLDSKIKADTIKHYNDKALGDRLEVIHRLLDGTLPDLSRRFSNFYFEHTSTAKRFILVDELPKVHEAADGLVGLQRGPNVWVKRSFWDGADGSEKADFFLHEFFVSEKLKNGALGPVEREEVVNTTAAISEKADQIGFLASQGFPIAYGRELQGVLEKNHFEAALRKDERDRSRSIGDKLFKGLQKGCGVKKPDPQALEGFYNLMKYVKRHAKDNDESAAMRKEFQGMVDQFEDGVKEHDGNVCAFWKSWFEDAKTTMATDPEAGEIKFSKEVEEDVFGTSGSSESSGSSGAQ